MDQSEKLKAFIKQNEHLFWYTPSAEKENISMELLLEQIINFGSLESIKELIGILGIENAKSIFEGMTGRKKHNIYPELHNFMSEYFKHVA